MRVRFRGDFGTLRSSLSFSTSGLIHGGLLALLVFGQTAPREPKPKSIYDELIRPHEKQLVWYHAPDRLPDVRPAASRPDGRPLRARRVAPQRIVAGPRDDGRPPQLVWSPTPDLPPPRPTPLPNILAVEMKAPVRAFTPPPARKLEVPAADLPQAEAPPLAAAPAGPALSPLRRTFSPPPVKAAAVTTPTLPDAAAVPAVAGAAPVGPILSPLKRAFTAPPLKTAALPTAALPDAEAIVTVGRPAPSGPDLAPLRKSFTPPAAPSPSRSAAPGPDLPPVAASVVAQYAIVGLDPAKTPIPPAPPAPRTAGFSAGPKLQPDGAATDGSAVGVVVPGVTVRDGPARQSLLAAIRPMAPPLPAAPPLPGTTPPRASAPPDPSLEGRVVYSVAIQMPNITSYSGSWLVWFAERQGGGSGTVRAPSPVRKVDPKYIASAAAEGVQGVVRLGAVIRKDGHVEAVKLLRHLDERLDHSAMESLAKWQFEPALRDGAPIDVDAVFEIPFRLAPKISR